MAFINKVTFSARLLSHLQISKAIGLKIRAEFPNTFQASGYVRSMLLVMIREGSSALLI